MIPVIDIFAGPGGLGEGFSAACDETGNQAFDLVLSVEKDVYAFETLRLRSFFRQFSGSPAPDDYYACLRGEIGIPALLEQHPSETEAASSRTWRAELGAHHASVETVRERVDAALSGRKNWVLIGGPPCQAFSIAGRSRNRGNKGYRFEQDIRQRLYIEYLQILADHRPVAFIMENVKGLLSATIRNQRIFKYIVEDLTRPAHALVREGRSVRGRSKHGYRIYSLVEKLMFTNGDLEASLIEAERYGIPQKRHRVILFGIRDDLKGVAPAILKPQPEVPLSHVLGGMPPVRSGLSRKVDGPSAWRDCLRSGTGRRWANAGTRKAGGKELQLYILDTLRSIEPPELDRGAEFVQREAPTEYAPEWFGDPKLRGICNHATRAHMVTDLYRYLYAACFAKVHGRSPSLRHFPTDLLPDHVNVDSALTEGGNFSDRFRVHLYDQPAATVTSHIHKDGHYYIHPDPAQCRSLTVREAARLQTFPDNYFFCGPRTAQYIQVGNAVPPLLARQIAEIVLDALHQAGVTD